MGLWNPGKLDVTLDELTKLKEIADRDYDPDTRFMREEHPNTQRTFVINELVPYESDVDGEYHILCEFTYNTAGHRAGFGLRTSDRTWICFYD